MAASSVAAVLSAIDNALDNPIATRDVHAFMVSHNPISSNMTIPVDYAQGVRMGLATTVWMIILELLSIGTVLGMVKKQPKLYAAAWITTLRNNLIIGPVVAYVAFEYFCTKEALEPVPRLLCAMGVVLVHSVSYYIVHRAMHTRALYWAHKFHHKFNEFVTPTSANAVSLTEYALAYMLPFVIASLLLRPDAKSMYLAIAFISVNNLLIHTPPLETLAAKLLPSTFFVGTDAHIEHHQKLVTHYAAPTLNIDSIVSAIPALGRLADAAFLRVGGKPVAVVAKKKSS